MMRFANLVGPRMQTPLTAYFSLPVVPTVLGFDARLQFLHEDDGLEAMRLATVADRPGTFNVAGDGVVMLSQAVRRLGRPSLPVPPSAVPLLGQLIRRAGLADFSPEQMRFLSHGRVMDTTRMRQVLGFVPRHTSLQAFDAFASARGLVGVPPGLVRAAERQVLAAVAPGAAGRDAVASG